MNPALQALHAIFVLARMMAYEANEEELARLMDDAEILPKYLAETRDATTDFRMALEALADRYPYLAEILKHYNNDSSDEW